MRYLVTGGTGFLGRAVVETILNQGHDVVIFDNNSRGNPKLLSKNNVSRVIEGDIRDPQSVQKALKNVDKVVHLAYVNGTKFFYSHPDNVIDVGIRGMINLLDCVKNTTVNEFILFSTSEVYNHPKVIPTPEEIELTIPDIRNPRFSYGGSKIACELMLVNSKNSFGDNWKIIRPHNVYGPNMGEDHVIPELFKKAMYQEKLFVQGNGEQTRSFCYIDDFKHAFEIVLKYAKPKEILNIGTFDEITIRHLANIVLEVIDKKMPIEFGESNVGEPTRRCPDLTKIMNYGYSSKVNIREGLSKFFKYNYVNDKFI